MRLRLGAYFFLAGVMFLGACVDDEQGFSPKRRSSALLPGQIYPLPPPPTCGNKTCEAATEDCQNCPQDCGICTGCQAKLGPGCPGCKCEACVCAADSACCNSLWDSFCADDCKNVCGGCGATEAGATPSDAIYPPPPPTDTGTPPTDTGTPPPSDASAAVCGDKTCNATMEDCQSCPQDCGICTGCQAKLGPGCPGCKCEACVCAADAFCCSTQWDSNCADDCKNVCGGCGTTEAGAPPSDAVYPPPADSGTPPPLTPARHRFPTPRGRLPTPARLHLTPRSRRSTPVGESAATRPAIPARTVCGALRTAACATVARASPGRDVLTASARPASARPSPPAAPPPGTPPASTPARISAAAAA